jgi:hypothetical protein
MRGIGQGVSVSRTGQATWLTPHVDIEVTTAPWLFGTRGYLGGGAGMPLIRSPFIFGKSELVHQSNSLVWLLNAGLELDWE